MEEKTQKPTPKRLRDARKRGEVVISQDVTSSAVFIITVVAVWLMGAMGFGLLKGLWLQATGAAMLARPGEHMAQVLQASAHTAFWGTVPIVAVALVGAAAAAFFQVGGLAAWEKLKPDLNHLNPAEGLKRIVSTRNLVNLLKMLLKTALLAALMFAVIRGTVGTALKLGHAPPATILGVGARIVFITLAWAAVVYLLMAAVDYAHQYHEFMKKQRMSIDEVRREYKDNEGDPINKGRRRSAHFEAVYAGLADRVRASSAVIHAAGVAVALQYLGDKDLPRVIARGQGDVAAQIRRFASEALVPTEFDSELAQRLHEDVGLDMAIPRGLYERVAKLLRWAQGEAVP
jgi:type III secretion protein U